MDLRLQPGDLIIIAGRPSYGQDHARRSHIRRERRVGRSNKSAAIFSMEMSAESLTLTQ